MIKPLHIQIDPQSGVPVYRQIMDQIKYYIASGVLKGGDQLPSIRDLAQSLVVNPTTVVKVFTELQHAGVVEIRHGKGAFVASGATGMTDREREKSLRRIARQMMVEAGQMGASAELVRRVVEEELSNLPDNGETSAE